MPGRLLLTIGLIAIAGGASAQTLSEILDASGDGAGNPLDTPRGIGTDSEGNVYVAGRWDRVEHYHLACYHDAGDPYGQAA